MWKIQTTRNPLISMIVIENYVTREEEYWLINQVYKKEIPLTLKRELLQIQEWRW